MQPATGTTGGNSGAQFPSFSGDASFSGDTFSVTGQTQIAIPYFQMADQMRQDFEDGHELQSPSLQPLAGVMGESTPSSSVNSKTSTVTVARTDQLHGEFFWAGGNSALNAEPFVLAGQPRPNPSYNSNGYGVVIGGQPFLPGLTKPSPRDSLVVSYTGQLSRSLVDQYGVVPTELEREGNFSQLTGPDGLIPIYPPRSFTPYPNNTIDTPLDPAALALLAYLPKPNLDSSGLNYRLATTQGIHTNTIGASYTHTFGALTNGTGQTSNTVVQATQSLSVNFNLGEVATDVVNTFPDLGGKQRAQGYSLIAGYTFGKNERITNINIVSARNNSQVRNYFTGQEDVATKAGLFADASGAPINLNPQNYGLPNLVFNNFTGFNETQPNSQLTQIFGVSATSSWTGGPHILRFGGDVHRIEFFGSPDATGTFIFTGGYTQIERSPDSSPVASTGSSFADFLLGLPQETKIEAPDQKAYTRQTNWDLFVRDDWRVLSNLTLCLGLRYDYFSPFVEKYNRLSTLDYNSDFTDVAAVQPNQIGPVSGAKYPRGLVQPDRDNFSPHVGLAWQAARRTVVRSGYSIDYTVGQYGTFVQNLAYQPPFADVQANGNVPHDLTTYTLKYGFGNLADIGNFAVNRSYRTPYVQVWYLDVQQSLLWGVVLDAGYIGAKGTKLDVISAPGEINSLPFASAYFDFEDFVGFSTFNALVVRANKRMGNGLVLQSTYIYSHSIDDASSINAGSPIVAQNWQDIPAETGNSSFDIRHQITGSFLYALPFGARAKLLNHGWISHAVDNWSVSGFFILATGLPLTPYVSASVAEVERGTHGSVRPNRVPGVSIAEGGGHIDHWFNTAAFSADFAPNQLFGDASRYSIPGPGMANVNFSVSKIISLADGRSLEIRGTANNALNIVQYGGVNTQIGSSTFGYVNAVQPMRQITFLARFRF
jgi:trimeric autotransporter adhesin